MNPVGPLRDLVMMGQAALVLVFLKGWNLLILLFRNCGICMLKMSLLVLSLGLLLEASELAVQFCICLLLLLTNLCSSPVCSSMTG